jgi:hypothetical protein
MFDQYGRSPDPKHIKAIMDLAEPRDLKALRHILGLANFNREYIPHYMEVTRPLQDLNKADMDVGAAWQDEVHGRSFRALQYALSSAPCLMTIDASKPFCLHVDTSKERGIGAVLCQKDFKGDWRPVSYYSVRLRGRENEWSASELEAMGLVYAIRHWSTYLKVQKFTAVVDHSALVWLVNRPAKTANGRILHWISDLLEYHFDIIHRAGNLHIDADAISRLFRQQDMPAQQRDGTDQEPLIEGPFTEDDARVLSNKVKYLGEFVSIVHDLITVKRSQVSTPSMRAMLGLLLKVAEAEGGEKHQMAELARDTFKRMFPMEELYEDVAIASVRKGSNATQATMTFPEGSLEGKDLGRSAWDAASIPNIVLPQDMVDANSNVLGGGDGYDPFGDMNSEGVWEGGEDTDEEEAWPWGDSDAEDDDEGDNKNEGDDHRGQGKQGGDS